MKNQQSMVDLKVYMASADTGDSKCDRSCQTVSVNPATCWMSRGETPKQNYINS